LIDPRIEEHFRSEIRLAWSAVEALTPNSPEYAIAFQRYCRLLLDSDFYHREGRLPGKASAAGR
jgi:hypothetical protein